MTDLLASDTNLDVRLAAARAHRPKPKRRSAMQPLTESIVRWRPGDPISRSVGDESRSAARITATT